MSRSTNRKNHSRGRNKAAINFDSKAFRTVLDAYMPFGPIEWELLTKGYVDLDGNDGNVERWEFTPIEIKGEYGESPLARFRRESELV